jgi:hypothetical protein
MQAVRDGYRSGTDGPFQVKGCQVQWYSPEEACRVIKESGGLALVGDSLMRDIAVALLLILSGDYESATSWRTSRFDMLFVNCDCDAGFVSWTNFIKSEFPILDEDRLSAHARRKARRKRSTTGDQTLRAKLLSLLGTDATEDDR